MIQSCISIINQNPHIRQVLVLTGDGGFRHLLAELGSIDIKVLLIANIHTISQKLFSAIARGFDVQFVADFPQDWWLR